MWQWFKNTVRRTLSHQGYNVDRIPPVLGANPRARLKLSFDHVLCRYLVHQPGVPYFVQMADLSAPPDIVVIDTEGYDFEVIKHLRSAGLKPRLILYEQKHLSAANQNACVGLLLAAGYEVASVGEDTVAYSPDGAG